MAVVGTRRVELSELKRAVAQVASGHGDPMSFVADIRGKPMGCGELMGAAIP